MRDVVKKIIKEKKEPVYRLDEYFESLSNDEAKIEFFECLIKLVFEGSKDEQIASLYVIIANKRVDILKEKICILLKEGDLLNNRDLLSPLFLVCRELQLPCCIEFIKKVISNTNTRNEEEMTYTEAIRSIVGTSYWRDVIDEINTFCEFSDKYIIDFMAYFIWRQNENEYSSLIQALNDKCRSRINMLNKDILIRYNQHYGKVAL